MKPKWKHAVMAGVVTVVLGISGCGLNPQPFEYHNDLDEKPGPGLFSGEMLLLVSLATLQYFLLRCFSNPVCEMLDAGGLQGLTGLSSRPGLRAQHTALAHLSSGRFPSSAAGEGRSKKTRKAFENACLKI